MAYFLFIIKELAFRSLLPSQDIQHIYWLGVGAGSGALSLLFVSLTLDRIRHNAGLLLLAGITPVIIGLFGFISGTNGFSSDIIEAWIISVFVCVAFFLATWVSYLNRTVIAKYRGRISGTFIFLSLLIMLIYTLIEREMYGFGNLGLPLMEIISIIAVAIAAAFRPWRWKVYSLAVHGNHYDYFVPTAMLLASHILWFFGTKWNIQDVFGASHSAYISWSQWAGYALYEPLIIAIGALLAGIMADSRGRKTTLNASILLMGLLAIYSPSAYNSTSLSPLLVVAERFVEGFIIGILCLLIWTELGSPKTKIRRISLAWFFFLGYALLLFGVDHELFGLSIPLIVGQLGAQTSIVISLVALTLASHIPTILGREVEMEDLSFDFDDKQVKATVDAFVGSEDFASIRSQMDLIDGTEDLSDSEFDEIVGNGFEQMLPLRRVPGIGPKLDEKLRKAGYTSAAQLAGETSARLSSKIDGLSLDRAEKIISDARATVKKTMKKGK
ncbi:MAG: helix-hairpin-helix domain-containing protein [Candidatus Thorarchaeota archaeon]